MKNKKCTIIDHSDIMECWGCGSCGVIVSQSENVVACPLCDGKGKYRESHYYIIDNKIKIAIDSDTIG